MEFTKDGVLEPGLHRIDFSEFEEFFVNGFDTSQTRKAIYESFIAWLQDAVSKYKILEIWIDGSFVTQKINPNDVDLVVYVHAQDFIEVANNWSSIRNKPLIDAYYALAICEESEKIVPPKDYNTWVNQRNYWRGQFGYDRNDTPKGFIVLDCNELEDTKVERGDV